MAASTQSAFGNDAALPVPTICSAIRRALSGEKGVEADVLPG